MTRPHALDLFCGAGGASVGLHRAGFDVTGVDVVFQPRYPFRFIQADALTFPLDGYDLIWASPPCQAYSAANNLWSNEHPDLLAAIRDRLDAAGTPYIIENVIGAPLRNAIVLCGTHFGLRTYRHRQFESNCLLLAPSVHPRHTAPLVKCGRRPREGDFINPIGNFSGVAYAQRALGIDWMGQKELSQAIPPAYSEFLARQIPPDLPARSTITPSRQGGG